MHFDQESPEGLCAQEVAVDATYCCHVHKTDRPFKTADARVAVMTGWCSIRRAGKRRRSAASPLLDHAGHVLGTLCHYDVVPRAGEQVNIELMLSVAGFLALEGSVPPYPSARPSCRTA